MARHALLTLAAWSMFALTSAQTFEDLVLPVSWPNITDSCAKALNTTVHNCPTFLGHVSVDTPRLKRDQLAQLCTKDCQTSLASVRKTIAAGCDSDNNIIEWDGVGWPATLVIDRFQYTYDLSCRVDADTGEYCDIIFFSWLNQTSFSRAQNCSDCALGTAQIQLSSPFEYEDLYAEEFQSLTSSSGATGYAFTSPSPYAISSATETGSPTSMPSPICLRPYQVQAGDTCDSIATSQQVSTYGVIAAGGLNPECTNLRADSTLCLPDACTLHRVQLEENCTNIVSAAGIDGQDLLAWNPNINPLCGNIYDMVGDQICIGPPGGQLEQVTISEPLAVSTATSPVPKPTNAPPESKARCGSWYTIQEGDYCDKVSVEQSISLDDFYFLNPEINNECTNLLLGLAYCVAPVGDIATYTGYPKSSAEMTLTSASFTTTSISIPPVDAAVTSTTALPLASGSIPECDYYVEPIPVPGIVDQSDSEDYFAIDASINSCGFVAAEWGVTVDDLQEWNPSLASADPCMLDEEFRYCALKNATAVEPHTPEPFSCEPVEKSDIQPTTIDSCSCFMILEGNRLIDAMCEDIATDYRTTMAKLMSWNPWLGSDCNSGLYDGISDNGIRPLCVGVNSTAPTGTATKAPTAASTQNTASMGPTQTDIVQGCQKYYTVKDGDTCASVYGQAGITFDQLYAWNPAVGPECHNLWLGYAYCVSGPPTSTSSSPSATPASAAPTRSGTPDDCTKYYTVESGDGCAKIQDLFSIDFATLYRWNPSIGANCENLWVDYGVCVAGGPEA